jgi:type II secretion system protein G
MAGFTLAELLIVVAIIGIIVAIAVPRLQQAISMARQRRTMGDMRTVSLAISAYGTDFVRIPNLANGLVVDIVPSLTPTYLKVLPTQDAWYNELHYQGVGMDYTIWSYAADGIEQSPLVLGPTTTFADDIVLSNGVFVQWPQGMQSK